MNPPIVSVEVMLLDEQSARQLTDRIRDAAGQLWSLLAEAHDLKAWAALGYESFKAYVETEFGMSKQRAYQLLDQARVITAITEAAGVESTDVDLTEAAARDLKHHLELLTDNVRDATAETEPEMKPEATRAAIEETRQHIQEQTQVDAPRPRPISKPDVGGGVSHPARFSEGLLPVFAEFLELGWHILDPFAGVGTIHDLAGLAGVTTVGVEIEPEWASLHPDTELCSALDMPFPDESFDAIVTSPTYGNRLADHHEVGNPATDFRRSYRHDLGRALSPDNSGSLQWGPKYRDFHWAAWEEALRVLRPGGRFILNIKDHIRDGRRQAVSAWHARTLLELGCSLEDCVPIVTPHLRFGTNAENRVAAELVWVLTKEIGR